MGEGELLELLRQFRQGSLSEPEMMEIISRLPYHDLGCAKLDTHRGLRCGIEEVVFCPGKSDEQLEAICKALLESSGLGLFTRVSAHQRDIIERCMPDAAFFDEASIAVANRKELKPSGAVTVVTGGTSDIGVAEEAAVTAEILGNRVERIYDVGAAGIHRLFPYIDILRASNAVVVVAGMEGALVTVVAGLVPAPVIAVPTSVGYGANLGGLTTMLSMLNCCVPGVSVVNIDNGFGAGVSAHLINSKASPGRT